jgi:DNA modification methylase
VFLRQSCAPIRRTGERTQRDGHLRVETMGDQVLPVLVLDVDEAEGDKVLATLDPLAAMAESDAAKLDAILREVDTGSPELQQMLSDLAEDAGLYQDEAKEIVEDEIPEPPVDPITKPGDLWTLGDHRLLCGDSTKAEDVERLMAGAKARLVITDPPYGVDYQGGTTKREKLKGDHDAGLYLPILQLANQFSDDECAVYLWHSDSKSAAVSAAVSAAGYELRCTIIWNKNIAQFGALGAQYKTKHEPCHYLYKKSRSPRWFGPTNEVTVWDISRNSKNEHHPTEKPVAVMARPMGNSSEKGDAVLDLFLGSGTTLIAAEQLGRKCYGMEISPQYCDVIVKRWETLTGKKAELETPAKKPKAK